jgi:hypothetical protein
MWFYTRLKTIAMARTGIGVCLLLGAWLTLSEPAVAATHWVSPTGAAANWEACKSDTPLSGTAACTIAQANTNALAGDTVYIRGGTYIFDKLNGAAIVPKNSGTCPGTCLGGVGASRIIFAAYPGETPIFQQANVTNAMNAISFSAGQSWIKVTGIIFDNFTYSKAIFYKNASYNEVSYCEFVSHPGFEEDASGFIVGQGFNPSASVHNWIHHNYLSMTQHSDPCGERADLFRFGHAQIPIPQDNYNTFEYNYVEYAGHALVVSNALYNVIAHNIGHDEPFIDECTNYITDSHPSSTTITIPAVGSTVHLVTDTGISNLTLTSNKGLTILLASDYSVAMEGRVLQSAGGYNSTTGDLYLVVDNVIGSGTYSNWIITQDNVPQYENPIYNGLFSHRSFGIGDNHTDPTPRRNVVEGNRIGFMGLNPGNAGDANMTMAFPYNIARYNFIYGGQEAGIYFKWADGVAADGGVNNYVYNNTIYANGHGWNRVYGGMSGLYMGQGIAQLGGTVSPTNNRIKNNLLYGNGQGDICKAGWLGNDTCGPETWDMVDNNWCTHAGTGPCSPNTYGDPLFVNPDLTDTLSQNLFPSIHGYTTYPLPDLRLQSSSRAIGGGTYLTKALLKGSHSTTLVVEDAGYFQDGTAGSDLARGVTFFPDWIAIGEVDNVVQISAIDYDTNTITLASPMRWKARDPVWLYKKSDGTVVLNGLNPDFGASADPFAF